jgi:hypothetical protein
MGTKMHSKQRIVKFTTVLLPFFCFAVERRVKNKFCLLLTEWNTSLKFLLHKENVPVDGSIDLSVSISDNDKRPI